jgi:DNA-binding MarR family transcriptional regulator
MNAKLEDIAEDLFMFMPFFHRKLIRSEHSDGLNPVHPSNRILGMLSHCGALPTSEIGKKLFISKPNMTALVDKLIDEGKVQRIPDKDDRRIINIQITEKGRKAVKENIGFAKEIIKKNLSSLDNDDLGELYRSLEKIKKVFSKLEKEDK